MLWLSLTNAINKSPVKWKKRTKDLSEKAQRTANGNPISFGNGLHNGLTMPVVNAL